MIVVVDFADYRWRTGNVWRGIVRLAVTDIAEINIIRNTSGRDDHRLESISGW